MKLPWLLKSGGISKFGSRHPPDGPSTQKRSSVTAVLTKDSSVRHSGIRVSSPIGSTTAPERMWAPTSEPFSTMTTDFSGATCFNRIAAASPAGPAPTMTTSNSIDSRGGSSAVFILSSAFAQLFHAFPCSHRLDAAAMNFVALDPQTRLRLTLMDFGPREARELLAFYRDAGADALLAEEAIDRMADPAAAAFSAEGLAEKQPDESKNPRSASSITVRSGAPARNEERNISRQPTLPPPDIAAMAAREAATNAKDLDELRAILENFQGCGLRGTATQLVFADGNPQARVMFVGEAPGYEEDISGRPFVGRSGKLLDRMIEAIGLDRTSAYIANVVPWRPPGNRTPTPQETAICLPFIRRQIELADPDILVCLGGPSMQTLLGTKDGITRARGRWFTYDTGKREIRALATFHPAFLLRSPLQKRLVWRDLIAIKKALAQ